MCSFVFVFVYSGNDTSQEERLLIHFHEIHPWTQKKGEIIFLFVIQCTFKYCIRYNSHELNYLFTLYLGQFLDLCFSESLLIEKQTRAPYLERDYTPCPLLLHHSILNLCSQSVRHSTAGHGRHEASQHSKSGFLRWSKAFGHSRSHRCQWKPDCAVHLDNILHLSIWDNNNHCTS